MEYTHHKEHSTHTTVWGGRQGGECLSLGFTAVNRHYDQGNSYKDNILGGCLTGLEVQSIIIKVRA